MDMKQIVDILIECMDIDEPTGVYDHKDLMEYILPNVDDDGENLKKELNEVDLDKLNELLYDEIMELKIEHDCYIYECYKDRC